MEGAWQCRENGPIAHSLNWTAAIRPNPPFWRPGGENSTSGPPGPTTRANWWWRMLSGCHHPSASAFPIQPISLPLKLAPGRVNLWPRRRKEGWRHRAFAVEKKQILLHRTSDSGLLVQLLRNIIVFELLKLGLKMRNHNKWALTYIWWSHS